MASLEAVKVHTFEGGAQLSRVNDMVPFLAIGQVGQEINILIPGGGPKITITPTVAMELGQAMMSLGAKALIERFDL